MYMNSLGNNLREIWINLLREVAPFIEKGQSKEALMIKDQEVSRRVAKMSEMMHMSKQAHWKCSPETLKAVCIERVDYDHKKALISWTGSGATATCPFIPNAGTVLTASWVPLKELYPVVENLLAIDTRIESTIGSMQGRVLAVVPEHNTFIVKTDTSTTNNSRNCYEYELEQLTLQVEITDVLGLPLDTPLCGKYQTLVLSKSHDGRANIHLYREGVAINQMQVIGVIPLTEIKTPPILHPLTQWIPMN